jgi:hypothetical protein
MTNKLNSIVLLLPEITKGMKSVGSKALLNINKKLTVLDHQILYIKKYYKNTPIKIITGFDNDRIIKSINKYSNIDIFYHQDYQNYNQSEFILRYIKKHKPNNFLLINNGVLLKEKLNININRPSLFFLPKKKEGFNLGSNLQSNAKYLFYNLEYQWTECAFFDQKTINVVDKISKGKKIQNLFLFELINLLLERNLNIDFTPISNSKNILKINISADIQRTKNFYEKNLFAKYQ